MYFHYTCMSVLLACIPVYHICALCLWSSEKASEPLELALWMVRSCHVDAGNETQVLLKCSKCSQPLSHLSIPNFFGL